ncbi:hypothetical protein HYW39_02695, partial [Candidatus Curtissbacteria bacterium]|nr:hypothetical protein [Candidatus Curtissbacteria bacterium]
MTQEAIELVKPSVEPPKVIWRRKTAADIFYGDKMLLVRFDTFLNRIVTKVWSRIHLPRIPGSTTTVYLEALRQMATFVTKHQEPMEYT